MNSADHYIFHCKLIVFMDNEASYQSYTTVIQNRLEQYLIFVCVLHPLDSKFQQLLLSQDVLLSVIYFREIPRSVHILSFHRI